MSSPASSKADLAYESIRRRILDGTFSPGTRLVFSDLARELSVSAVPVREAIRRLEAESLVVFEPNVGARVAALDTTQWLENLEMFAILEGYATAASAPHLDEDDLAAAVAANDRMAAAVEVADLLGARRCNREFHDVITSRCANATILATVRQAWARMEGMPPSMLWYLTARYPGSVHEHAELLTLIRQGEAADQIERRAREHRLRTAQAIMDAERASRATA